MRLHEIQRIEIPFMARDAAFLDEQTVLVTDDASNLWRHRLDEASATLSTPAHEVLADFLRADARHAAGDYPRIVAGPGGSPVVVNTDDLVLVTPDAEGRWKTLLESWGMYAPQLAFSPDGRYLALHSESALLVFRMPVDEHSFLPNDLSGEWRSSTGHHMEPLLFDDHVDAVAWHPTESLLLLLRSDRVLRLVDPPTGEEVRTLGTVLPDYWDPISSGVLALALISDDVILSAHEYYGDGTESLVELYRIGAGDRVASYPLADFPSMVITRPGLPWFAIASGTALHVWNATTLEPIVGPMTLPGSRLAVSPSGRRLVTLHDGAITWHDLR